MITGAIVSGNTLTSFTKNPGLVSPQKTTF